MLELLVIHSVILTITTGFALHAWVRARKRATHVDLARFERLVTDLCEEQRALLASHKRLRSRVGMRELREKREGEEDPTNETPEEWKKRVRLELVTGKRKHE